MDTMDTMDTQSLNIPKIQISPSMYLEQARNCFSFLNWEVIDTSIDFSLLEEAILEIGFTEQNSLGDAFSMFVKKSAAKIILVPKTGRIQLRIDLLIAEEKRPQMAQSICKQISILLKQ